MQLVGPAHQLLDLFPAFSTVTVQGLVSDAQAHRASRHENGARITPRAGLSWAMYTCTARGLLTGQLIASFFCATGAFFGSVSDSTPS